MAGNTSMHINLSKQTHVLHRCMTQRMTAPSQCFNQPRMQQRRYRLYNLLASPAISCVCSPRADTIRKISPSSQNCVCPLTPQAQITGPGRFGALCIVRIFPALSRRLLHTAAHCDNAGSKPPWMDSRIKQGTILAAMTHQPCLRERSIMSARVISF